MTSRCLLPAHISSGFFGEQNVFLTQRREGFTQGAQRGNGAEWSSTIFKLPRRLMATPLQKFEGDFSPYARGRQCRQAMRTRLCGFSRILIMIFNLLIVSLCPFVKKIKMI